MPYRQNDYDSNPIDDFNAESVIGASRQAQRTRRAPKRYSDTKQKPVDNFDTNYVPKPQNRDYGAEYEPDEIPYFDPDDNNDSDFDDNKETKTPKTGTKRTSTKKRRSPANTAEQEKKGTFDGLRQFFCDGRFRLFAGALMFIVGLVILVVTISHISAGASDQSAVTSSTITDMANGKAPAPSNVGGAFGAWLSHVLFTDSLGIGAFMIVIYLWLLGASLLAIKKFSFWSLTFKCLLAAITISIVTGLATLNIPSPIYWGGTHGYFVNEFLIKHGGYMLALAVSAILIAANVCVYINDIARFWQIYRKKMAERKERLQAQRQFDDDILNDDAGNTQTSGTPTEVQNLDDVPGDDTGFDIENLGATTPAATPRSLEDIDNFGERDDKYDEPKPSATNTRSTNTSGIDDEAAIEIDSPAPFDGITLDPVDNNPDEPSFEVKTSTIEEGSDKGPKLEPISQSGYDPRADLSRFRMPSLDLLSGSQTTNVINQQEQEENKDRIIRTLNTYNIQIAHIEATVGPTVTLYEIVPAEGVRIAQIKNLEDDIAMSLSALGIRIIAPIPGKGAIGIEIPNRDPQTVSMRSVLASKAYQETKAALPLAMGATISNEIFIEDLTKMPHLLVAGGSGTGKSVGLNVIIASLIYKKHPSELKFVLIDPKMVEFSLYEKLERHYLAKLPDEDRAIITDPQKALTTLNSLCVEMDQRYELLSNAQARNIEDYNKKFCHRQLNPEKGHRYLPYLVVIVDEFADLIMTAGKEVYVSIARLAQKARAVGMHLIIATQRPSTDVITGVIKSNFLGRIAFKVSNMVDSKTILDCTGANRLIGRGDMLFLLNSRFERVQCAFMSTEDVEALTEDIDSQVGFEHAYYLPEWIPEGSGVTAGASSDRDPLFDESARFIITQSSASTSSLQRRYSIGYNRASRIMEQMEAAGIVGPASGAKPRSILVDSITLERILGNA